MTHHRRLPLIVGLPMAVATGWFIPIQGRINGALGVALEDGIGAAVVSFSTGLLVMTVISLALPRGRAGLARILPAVRERQFPPYYVLAGCIGALFVFAQSFTVGLLGVALFTVAAVTGQTLSGLLVDRMGIGPAGKRPITGIRVAGSIVLWLAWLIKLAAAGPGHALPAEWWYYLGGPMGCVFIAVAAFLVRSLGVLVTGLGMIAGQLLGSLALDLALPAPGTVVALPTVLGTVLTLAAIVLASLPWSRGTLKGRRHG